MYLFLCAMDHTALVHHVGSYVIIEHALKYASLCYTHKVMFEISVYNCTEQLESSSYCFLEIVRLIIEFLAATLNEFLCSTTWKRFLCKYIAIKP